MKFLPIVIISTSFLCMPTHGYFMESQPEKIRDEESLSAGFDNLTISLNKKPTKDCNLALQLEQLIFSKTEYINDSIAINLLRCRTGNSDNREVQKNVAQLFDKIYNFIHFDLEWLIANKGVMDSLFSSDNLELLNQYRSIDLGRSSYWLLNSGIHRLEEDIRALTSHIKKISERNDYRFYFFFHLKALESIAELIEELKKINFFSIDKHIFTKVAALESKIAINLQIIFSNSMFDAIENHPLKELQNHIHTLGKILSKKRCHENYILCNLITESFVIELSTLEQDKLINKTNKPQEELFTDLENLTKYFIKLHELIADYYSDDKDYFTCLSNILEAIKMTQANPMLL